MNHSHPGFLQLCLCGLMCLCPKPLAKMEAVDRGGADVQCQNLKFKF